jgi:adenylate kinase family enzyme
MKFMCFCYLLLQATRDTFINRLLDIVESNLEMPINRQIPDLQPRPTRGVFLLLGASGSGKGTIARQLLALRIVKHHISMGDLLRGMIERIHNNPNERSKLERELADPIPNGFSSKVNYFEHCVQNGLLIPNSWTKAVIEQELTMRPKLQTEPWVMDGYPRQIEAAQHLLKTLNQLEIPVLAVIHLSISLIEMQKRLLARGRSDDTLKAIENRFAFYQDHVLPTLEFLGKKVKLLEIDTQTFGTSSAEQVVLTRVLKALEMQL